MRELSFNVIFFQEHQFLGKSDNFIHAIVICRQRLIDCNAEEIMEILLKNGRKSESQESIGKLENGDLVSLKPEMPEEVSYSKCYCLQNIYYN